MDPKEMHWGPIVPDRFTIQVVDAPGPFLGTVHLDKLPYQHVDLSTLYPYAKERR